MTQSIDEKYRNIRMWMADGGIEIGYCDDGYNSGVTARVVDDGGVVWERKKPLPRWRRFWMPLKPPLPPGASKRGLSGAKIDS